MSASLESFRIFVYSRSNVNFKGKYYLSTTDARSNCNTSFACDFGWAMLSEIILIIQGHLQGQMVSFKVMLPL